MQTESVCVSVRYTRSCSGSSAAAAAAASFRTLLDHRRVWKFLTAALRITSVSSLSSGAFSQTHSLPLLNFVGREFLQNLDSGLCDHSDCVFNSESWSWIERLTSSVNKMCSSSRELIKTGGCDSVSAESPQWGRGAAHCLHSEGGGLLTLILNVSVSAESVRVNVVEVSTESHF